ncbi:MAG: lactonase family protein [Verrucomicrobiales bacterium]|nr:lactonase family protein [Verrucomicrobiales bacterium]
MKPLFEKWVLPWMATGLVMSMHAEPLPVFVGTYTGPKSEGIYAFTFDPETGKATPRGLVAKSVNPSFLAVHPSGRFLYAANETDRWKGTPGGYVTSFSISPTDSGLRELNQQSSGGAAPCFVSVDATGKNLLVANYFGGSVACLPIQTDGALKSRSAFDQHRGSSVDPQRQKEPHAHSIYPSPDNRFALSADLGLDQVLVYRLDPAAGTLTPNTPPFARVAPGSGPRHLAFAPDGRHLFVINEMLSTLTSMSYDPAAGTLQEIQTVSTLPTGIARPDTSTAQVCVHPNGRFVYGSNRGDDSIAVLSVEPGGRLKWVERVSTQGKVPRNFQIDPTGHYLWAANQNSDSIVLFRVDGATGKLTPTGQTLSVGSPVCVVFAPRPH